MFLWWLLASMVAATPRAQLTLQRGPGAESCPGEEAVRAAVAARLGYPPFGDDAPLSIAVTVEESDEGFRARISLGVAGPERILSSTDCEALTRAVELSIAIAIDPRAAAGVRKRPPAPAPEAPDLAPAATPSATPPPPEALPPTRTSLAFGVLGAVGLAPAPTVGFVAQLRLQRGHLRLAVEARGDVPAFTAVGGGRVGAAPMLLSLLGCGELRPLVACALVSGGPVVALGRSLTEDRTALVPQAGAGLRVLGRFELSAALAVEPYLDVTVPLVRASLRVDGAEIWRTWPLAGAFGVAIAWLP